MTIPPDDQVTGLVTCQTRRAGDLDGRYALIPAPGVTIYTAHLVRSVRGGGTPGPMLCGLDRFGPDAPGWSLRGGVTGPGAVQQPCPGCVIAWVDRFPELGLRGGVGSDELTAARLIYVGVTDPEPGPDAATWNGAPTPDRPTEPEAWRDWRGVRTLVDRRPVGDCDICDARIVMDADGVWGHVVDSSADNRHRPAPTAASAAPRPTPPDPKPDLAGHLLGFLEGHYRDAVNAVLVAADPDTDDAHRWRGHAELARQTCERIRAHADLPAVDYGGTEWRRKVGVYSPADIAAMRRGR